MTPEMKKKYQLPIVVALTGFLYSGYLLYTFTSEEIPRLGQRLTQRETALATKKGELKRVRNFSENIEAVKLSLRELSLQLESALESMPRTYDFSGLLRKISMIGFNSGVQVGSFHPDLTPKKEGEFYETVPIGFTLEGSFTQALSFFDQMLRLRRIIHIERIELRAPASASTARTDGAPIQANVKAKVYRFLD